MNSEVKKIENELQSVLSLKTLLHSEKQVLVGLEYLIYLHDGPVNRYICSLCVRKGDFFNIIAHYASVKHKRNILKEHFPSVSKHLQSFARKPEKHDRLVSDLCALIEDRLGRSMPLIISEKSYEAKPNFYKRKAMNGDHFSEKTSLSLLILLMQEIKKAEKRSRDRSRSKSPEKKKSRRESPKDDCTKSQRESSSDRRPQESSRSKHRETSSSHGSRRESSSSSVEDYRRVLEKETEDIDKRYKRYKQLPESHPKYTEEWNEFWLLNYYRAKGAGEAFNLELLNEPWLLHFRKRFMELHDEELLELKVKLREKMNLPIEPSDLNKWEMIRKAQMVKIREVNPTVPIDASIIKNGKDREVKIPSRIPWLPKKRINIVDLNELASNINSKRAKLDPPKVIPEIIKPAEVKSKESVITESPCGFEGGDERAPGTDANEEVSSNGANEERLGANEQNAAAIDRGSDDPKVSCCPSKDESEKVLDEKSKPQPTLMGSLTKKDLIVLFCNYDNLSEQLQIDLKTYMKNMEETDPEQYHELQDSPVDEVDDAGEEDKAQSINKEITVVEPLPDIITLEPAVLPNDNEDNDDCSLEDTEMMRSANEAAVVIEVSDHDDSSPELIIDLTEE